MSNNVSLRLTRKIWVIVLRGSIFVTYLNKWIKKNYSWQWKKVIWQTIVLCGKVWQVKRTPLDSTSVHTQLARATRAFSLDIFSLVIRHWKSWLSMIMINTDQIHFKLIQNGTIINELMKLTWILIGVSENLKRNKHKFVQRNYIQFKQY